MSEIPLDPDGQVPQKGTGGRGIVMPDAVEALLADMETIKTSLAALSVDVSALKSRKGKGV